MELKNSADGQTLWNDVGSNEGVAISTLHLLSNNVSHNEVNINNNPSINNNLDPTVPLDEWSSQWQISRQQHRLMQLL